MAEHLKIQLEVGDYIIMATNGLFDEVDDNKHYFVDMERSPKYGQEAAMESMGY